MAVGTMVASIAIMNMAAMTEAITRERRNVGTWGMLAGQSVPGRPGPCSGRGGRYAHGEGVEPVLSRSRFYGEPIIQVGWPGNPYALSSAAIREHAKPGFRSSAGAHARWAASCTGMASTSSTARSVIPLMDGEPFGATSSPQCTT